MTFAYLPHLILAGLIGIHCTIITVDQVSIEAGGSISIPCLYEESYKDHVKYLCRGVPWWTCTYVIKTNQEKMRSGRFSISDDTTHKIFTVTINNVTNQDDTFWCAVEKKHLFDDKQRFRLSVSTGTPHLFVSHQEVTAFEGGSVTALCHYKYAKVTKWCRLGSTCVADETGSIDGTSVNINRSVPNVFNVTMNELTTESSGWYWCTNEDFQMPVHVTVHELTSTTTTTLNPSTDSIWTLSTSHQLTSLHMNAEPHTGRPTNSTINGAGGENLQDQHKSSAKLTILITILVIPLLIVPAAFFGRRMITQKKTKPEVCDITAGSPSPEPDVVYVTVDHNRYVAAQTKDSVTTEDVTYSMIVIKNNVQQVTEPEDSSVIYSVPK